MELGSACFFASHHFPPDNLLSDGPSSPTSQSSSSLRLSKGLVLSALRTNTRAPPRVSSSILLSGADGAPQVLPGPPSSSLLSWSARAGAHHPLCTQVARHLEGHRFRHRGKSRPLKINSIRQAFQGQQCFCDSLSKMLVYPNSWKDWLASGCKLLESDYATVDSFLGCLYPVLYTLSRCVSDRKLLESEWATVDLFLGCSCPFLYPHPRHPFAAIKASYVHQKKI